MRISAVPKYRVHAKLRVEAQGDLGQSEKLQTKRQRDRRIEKLQELINEISPQTQDPERGPQVQTIIDQLKQQIQNVQQINEIGGEYYDWLQGEPQTLEEIPAGGETTPWDQPAPAQTAPKFPPAKITPPPKTIDTAKDVPLDLSQEQQGLDQAALEQKALDIDRFIEDIEGRAGDLLTTLKTPDAQVQGDPQAYKRKLTELVNYMDGEIARVKPIADSLLSQIGGGEAPAAKAPAESIDTGDFEKYFPEV